MAGGKMGGARDPSRTARLLVILTSVALLLPLLAPGPTVGAPQGERVAGPYLTAGNGLIAFTSDRSGDSDVYVMGADGSNQVDLTNDSGSDSQPAWSPDGTHIAFTSDRSGDSEVYVMGADGSNQVDLTNDSGSDSQPAWSPDRGSRILFTSDRTGEPAVYAMSSAGLDATEL